VDPGFQILSIDALEFLGVGIHFGHLDRFENRGGARGEQGQVRGARLPGDFFPTPAEIVRPSISLSRPSREAKLTFEIGSGISSAALRLSLSLLGCWRTFFLQSDRRQPWPRLVPMC